VQFLADDAQFFFALGPLLDGQFFDFQLGFAAAIVDLPFGLLDGLAGLFIGVSKMQVVEQLDGGERRSRGAYDRY
jgi:hypothetical protein